ncbi:hypothetical protein AVEN_222017-1 [Araneus ventricosus]|uniref:Uncharacterized protein n=1 Tax=Araneus ventricosus TaxID=182803 RepID=A0A4Y2LH69_ARAVE|nr:hypothetical protein AVEN_222017-1 [Araneus ventricosus]
MALVPVAPSKLFFTGIKPMPSHPSINPTTNFLFSQKERFSHEHRELLFPVKAFPQDPGQPPCFASKTPGGEIVPDTREHWRNIGHQVGLSLRARNTIRRSILWHLASLKGEGKREGDWRRHASLHSRFQFLSAMSPTI